MQQNKIITNLPFLLGKSYTGNKSTPDLTSIDGYRLSGFGYNAYWSTTATYDVTFNENII